jgi:hypothetical protein
MRNPLCNNRFSSLSEAGLSACFPLLPTATQFPTDRQERKAANHRQLSFCPEAPASGSPGWLGAVTKVFRETGGSRPLVLLSPAVLSWAFWLPLPRRRGTWTFPANLPAPPDI